MRRSRRPQAPSFEGEIMSFAKRFPLALGVLLVASAPSIHAQTSFPEIEPNGVKAEATPATCVLAGDSLTGTTTGSSATAANSALTSADTFLVETCALAPGVYRHRLTLTTGGAAGHVGTIRGLNQTGTVGVGGTAGTTDTTIQTSLTTTNPPRTVEWYGFGGGEEIFYRVTGTTTTTSPYSATLDTTPITPIAIGPFEPGSITFKFCGQGHTTDTELWIYDANLDAIPGYGDDDSQSTSVCGTTSLQSSLVRNFTAGTYFMAVARFNFANDQVASATDNYVFGALMDFPGSAADSNTLGANVSFQVIDALATTSVAANTTYAFEILWYRFDVGSGGSGTSFCVPGTAGVMACACGNANGAGKGCANTGSTGASLGSSGSASLAANVSNPGSLSLTGTSMLAGSSCIFLQGDGLAVAGTTFGAGVRCTAGTLKRLYVKTLVGLGGTQTAPQPGDLSIPNRSAALGDTITAGSTRWYQTYYRDPNLPNPGGACPAAATFNVTSGQQVVWSP